MQYLTEFLLSLQTYNLKILTGDVKTKSISITHENGYRTNVYANKLIALKEMAIIDLLPFDYMQIQIFLEQINKVSSKFRKFWLTYYNDAERVFDKSDEHYLQSECADKFFIINGFDGMDNTLITSEFGNELIEAIEFKEHLLNSFVDEMDQLLHYSGSGFGCTFNDLKSIEVTRNDIKEISKGVRISSDVKNEFCQILKKYFTIQDHSALEKLILDGDASQEKLNFHENGNQLADAFKQLYEANLIVGCTKAELERWIARNFSYNSNNRIKHFTEGYLNAIVSSDLKKCQSPILDVRKQDGQFTITTTIRNKKNYQIG